MIEREYEWEGPLTTAIAASFISGACLGAALGLANGWTALFCIIAAIIIGIFASNKYSEARLTAITEITHLENRFTKVQNDLALFKFRIEAKDGE